MAPSDQAGTNAPLERASALLDLGRWPEAVTALGAVVSTDPDNSYAWCLMAHGQLGMEDIPKAEAAARRAIALEPGREWAHRLLSTALSVGGNHAAAIASALEAVRIAPWLPETHRNLARARLRAGQADQAEEAATKAVELAPNVADGHLLVGMARMRAGNPVGAEPALNHALSLEPENAVAHNELARLSLQRAGVGMPGTLAESAAGFAKALRVDPTATVSRRNLDIVLRAFLSRGAYFLFLAAWVATLLERGGLTTTTSDGTVQRVLAVALMAVPLWFTGRFLLKLGSGLRTVLWGVIRNDRNAGVAVGLEVLSVAGVIASAAVNDTVFALVAVVTAIVARLLLRQPGAGSGGPRGGPRGGREYDAKQNQARWDQFRRLRGRRYTL